MAWSVQEKGSGALRDLIVIAHGGVTQAIREAAPGAIVVGLAQKPLSGGYSAIGPGKVPPLAELVRGALEAAGGPFLGRLVLVGFSEGCQAVRAWLAAGEVPTAVLAIDGAHGSSPAPSPAQVTPWRSFFDRARAGERFAAITATRIPTSGYLPTAAMLPILTGFPPPPAVQDGVGALLSLAARWRAPETGFVGAESILMAALQGAAGIEAARPRVAAGEDGGPGWIEIPDPIPHWRIRAGLLVAEQWPGRDAPAHVQQARDVLPRLLAEAIASIDVPPWIAGLHSRPRPPEAPGSIPIQVAPPSGGGGGGGGAPLPLPLPPSTAPGGGGGEGGGGAGAFLALSALGLLALRGRRR